MLEELIRQMTAYRVDDFEDEDDFESIEVDDEHSAGEPVSTEVSSGEDSSVLAEVVEPRLVEITRRKTIPIEITERRNYKTKCQLLQEETDNGNVLLSLYYNNYDRCRAFEKDLLNAIFFSGLISQKPRRVGIT